MIEFTSSNELPVVNVYSRRGLRKILQRAGFVVDKLWVRKLVKEDLPIISLPVIGELLWKIWQAIPQRWLDFIGKGFGWYVIANVKKEYN